MTRLSNETEQRQGERLGRDLREVTLRYLADFAPPEMDAHTQAMNVGAAAVQCLGLDAADDHVRPALVEGVGYAVGIMLAQWAEYGGGGDTVLRLALIKGLARGRAETITALAPTGAVQ